MKVISKNKGVKPLEIFELAHKRASNYLSGDTGKKGRKDGDDLRAAVVFAVAAIDAYFRAKIIAVLRSKQQKGIFTLSSSAEKILEKIIARRIFNGKEYSQLKAEQKQAVTAMCESKKSYLITYLQAAQAEFSFQSVNQIDEGLKIMGENPSEIWNKIYQKIVSKKENKLGRPFKKKVGKPIEYKVQMTSLFTRRHIIVHEADINIRSRTYRGKSRNINFKTVKRWVESIGEVVRNIDMLVKD